MKLLIVEDEINLVKALKELLERQSYQVDTAKDGLSAYDMIIDQSYDLIILDIMMPKLNGLELLKDLRENQNETPVLMLTAMSQTEDKITGLNAGADDYLGKPFDFQELLARIAALTRRQKKLRQTLLTYEDLKLNTETAELFFSNREVIKLSPKELAIMECLINNGERVTTKETLLTRIWGSETNADYNHVEVYISFLRKKLDKSHSSVVIKTHRGIGYSLAKENLDD